MELSTVVSITAVVYITKCIGASWGSLANLMEGIYCMLGWGGWSVGGWVGEAREKLETIHIMKVNTWEVDSQSTAVY